MNIIALFQALDVSQGIRSKRDACAEFIASADPLESAYTIKMLRGEKIAERIPSRLLKHIAHRHFTNHDWIFDECYGAVGDLSETLAILCSDDHREPDLDSPVIISWLKRIKSMHNGNEDDFVTALYNFLRTLSRDESFLFLKLSTGGFRVGVSRNLIHDAISMVTGIDRSVIDERLMGTFHIDMDWLDRLSRPVSSEEENTRPLPFLLAHPWTDGVHELTEPSDLQIEYKWDGIRCQLIKTDQLIRLWSRGDQDITEQFPDITNSAAHLPSNLILDGEILIQRGDKLGTFQDLQTRLNRSRITKTLLQSHPAIFRPYDCLRYSGEDLRMRPLHFRRSVLETLPIEASPVLSVTHWEQLNGLRLNAGAQDAEGIMIKRRDGHYEGGRRAGLWWKWKLDPMTADCILIYAQAGHGRRASIHSDFTLAVFDGEHLVPITKAYSGLSNDELKEVDQWIRTHTIEKFGPVRQVRPELVFEIAFEGIARSSRHKSGIALRFPRILRWRRDIGMQDADTLESFEALLAGRE